ncbi:MAG: hypothetical protein ABSD89_09320 [Halobacteriota archaeon]
MRHPGRKTRFVCFVLVIVLSVSVAVAAIANNDVRTATGQTALSPYAPTATSSGTADPNTPIDTAVISSGGTPHHDITGLQTFEANGIITYEADGFRVVDDTHTGVWHFEWDVTNNLKVPMTIQPYVQLFGCDMMRTGTEPTYVFAGASQGCPASAPSVNVGSSLTSDPLTSAQPSAVDGTHDSTFVTMNFQVSTLNLPSTSTSSTATNNAPIIGKSVRNDFLKLHPAANLTSPAANPVQLRKSVCSVDSMIGTVNGTKTTLQPGQSATISSTVNSKDWGFACAPVNHALINYNVQAGGSSYQALKASELIVFGTAESNICGS